MGLQNTRLDCTSCLRYKAAWYDAATESLTLTCTDPMLQSCDAALFQTAFLSATMLAARGHCPLYIAADRETLVDNARETIRLIASSLT